MTVNAVGFPIRKRDVRSKEQGDQGREESAPPCLKPFICFIFIFKIFYWGVLICDVVLVAGVQKRESI